jgi:6-phosphogluconolactonase
MKPPKIDIAGSYEDLCEKVTQEILVHSNTKIALQNRFNMVLSGGSTPKGIYQCMSGPSYRNKFRWEKIHLFWGDERWVRPEDPRSNYRMVSQALLTKVNIPPANVHPVQTTNCNLQTSACKYEQTIRDFFKLGNGDFPRFDLVLLGLGQDGHTSSLFPGNSALSVKDRIAVSVSQKGIPEKRITLTLAAINHAETIFFLVSGPEKADIAAEVLENKSAFPANDIKPDQGHVFWFLDKASAGKLENEHV